MHPIVFIIGTRPNIIKAYPLYHTLHSKYKIYTIHTGQHYNTNMVQDIYKDIGLPEPDVFLELKIGFKNSKYQSQ